MKRHHAKLAAIAALSLTCASLAPAGNETAPVPGSAWEVPVERIKIQKEKPQRPQRPTLRFLEENLAFLRARIDPLLEVRERELETRREIDPRHLELLKMERALAQDRSELRDPGGDSLISSALAIAAVEAELDRLDDLLYAAEARLARLETDFVQRQSTGVLCVLRGRENLPAEFALHWEDGRRSVLRLGAADQAHLAGGGRLEVFHDLVEPRVQFVQLTCASETGGQRTGYLEIDPARDRLSVLELDISAWESGEGLELVNAQLWVLPDPRWQEKTGWMW